MDIKNLHFEVKEVSEDGTFEGLLSVYGNVDLGGDVVERGAFTKSLEESKYTVPMLWQHDQKTPIGLLEIQDSEVGLKVKGIYVLEVEKARESHALMKRGVIKGLSIGYQSIKDKIEKGIRYLSEIKLYEGSVVTFPMNPLALVTTVKSTKDFNEELDEAQLCATKYLMLYALGDSLDDAVWDPGMSNEQRAAAAEMSISQFHDAYMAWLPRYLAMMSAEMEQMADGTEPEHKADQSDVRAHMVLAAAKHVIKAGRMISAANMDTLGQARDLIQSVIDAAMSGDKAFSTPDSAETLVLFKTEVLAGIR